MSLTAKFILFAIAAIAIFDFYIVFEMGAQQSISAYIIRYSKEFPSIAFIAGYVCGHLFWRMPDKRVGGGDE